VAPGLKEGADDVTIVG
jgi:hypothetical protein